MRGVETVNFPKMRTKSTDEAFVFALREAVQMKFVSPGDPVICVHGTAEHAPGAANVVKIITCPKH